MMIKKDCKSIEEFFKENVGQRFLCRDCKDLLFNCFQSSCGCSRFCQNCGKNNICEDCKKEFSLYSDKGTVRELKRIKVKCYYDGCQKEFCYDNYKKHIFQCDFRDLECKECHEAVLQHKMNFHKKEVCEYRKAKCTICKKLAMYSKTKHIQFDETTPPECVELYGDCPNCQEKKIKLNAHYAICATRPCLLREYGCKGFVTSEKCSEGDYHQPIIEKIITSVRDDVKNMQKIEKPEDKLQESKLEIEKLATKVSKLKEKIEADLTLCCICKNGKLLWRITDVPALLDERSFRVSEPLYSDEYGYKLCMKIYPQGNGAGKNAYFSAYYVIMKGEYDELLQWPFNKKVRLTIHNQINKSKSKSEIYKPDFISQSIKKPEFDFNIATGNPNFIKRSELEETGFIKDDVMFIELTIHNDTLL